MSTPGLLAYVRPGPTFTGTDYFALPDFAGNLVYLNTAGAGTAAGWAKFNGYTDDSDLLDKAASTFPPVAGIDQANPSFHCLTYGGYLVFFSAASGTVWCVRASDFSYTSQIGSVPSPNNMGPLGYTGVDFAVICSAKLVKYLPVPALTPLTTLLTIDETTAFVGRGADGASSGTAFVIGAPSLPSSSAMGLYKLTASGGVVSSSKVGTVLPSAIDATWSTWSEVLGPAYDQVDGNVIITVATTDSVANKHYIAKINATTAAVMWTVAISSINTYDQYYLGRANITVSKLYYMVGTTLYTVNTSAGTATSATVGTLTSTANQISDDVSDSILVRGTWAQGTTVPTYLGTYMGTDGNHSLASETWMRYFPNGAPVPPVPPPPAPPFPIVSVNRAWTYTLDGHTFYVLDLGAEGTFVYDLDTEQWSQFQTNGGNWSMVGGCMFGQRIMAGDLATTDVWELVPSAVKDSGSNAYEITHITTGGVSLRTRNYISCSSLRVAASFGQLDDVAGVNMTLSFSDDQGQTWTTPAVIALTEGNYSGEIAWRSLGSFAAPGRIFQLTDSGGLIRIDGVDAMLDDFDDEKQPAEQG